MSEKTTGKVIEYFAAGLAAIMPDTLGMFYLYGEVHVALLEKGRTRPQKRCNIILHAPL